MNPNVVHMCPPEESGLTPCCHVSPFNLGPYHRITLNPKLVTCGKPDRLEGYRATEQTGRLPEHHVADLLVKGDDRLPSRERTIMVRLLKWLGIR